MIEVVEWEKMVVETKCRFISLWDNEYLPISRDMNSIFRKLINNDSYFDPFMSTDLLLKNFKNGLNYLHRKNIYTSILFIDSIGSSKFLQIGFYNTAYIEYIVLEKQVRLLIRRSHPKFWGRGFPLWAGELKFRDD